ncbi:uncharacterized protein BJX67DRAFT_350654, partial [Aspergillus lucknowensis]
MIDDGSFTVLISFGRDLVVTWQVVASVATLLWTIGNDGPDSKAHRGSASPVRGQDYSRKQLKANTSTSLASR